ncbi:MAG: MFS transporter [Nitrososphaeria archaeon]
MSSPRPERKDLISVPLIGLLRTFAIALVSPYLGLALYRKGMPLAYVGAAYLALAAFGALGQLFGGSASDALGRRPVMIMSQVASGLFLVLMGLSFELRGYAAFLAFSFLQTFFGSANMAAFNAYVGDAGGTSAEMVRGYSRMRVGINIGWAVGPLAGGVLIGLLGFELAWMISGGFVMASSVAFLMLSGGRGVSSGIDLRAAADPGYLLRISPFVIFYAFVAQFGLTLTIYETLTSSPP